MTELLTATGTDFVGYRIEELIGRGGMGVVYRAYDLRLRRTVALKLIAPEFAVDERFRERFARETELAMSLEHPNVVPIYDAGDVDGRIYLAMRLVGGTDLRKLLLAEGALEPARALAICRQVASALDAAFAKGLVHRDVKPSNVLLDENDHVYLADFGLTRRLDAPRSGRDTTIDSVGTPAYLAPEQIESKEVDGRTDLYSLGCMLFECLTGAPPFARGSRLETAWAHLEEEPPSGHALVPTLPEAIDPVVRQGTRQGAGRPLSNVHSADLRGRARARVSAFDAAPSSHVGAARCGDHAHGRLPPQRSQPLSRTDGHGKAAAPLFARADSLARIDPATNKVSAVIDVGATSRRSSGRRAQRLGLQQDGATISEIDADTNRVLKTTTISGFTPAQCCSLFAGPVLAADASGAWFVNGEVNDEPRLTHVLAGGGSKREYPLDFTPTGVAAGKGDVWVVGHRGRDYQVVRIDPSTGRMTARTTVPRPLEGRLDRLRLRRRVGHELVDCDALPDRSSLGPPDGECRGRQPACDQARDHASGR